MVHGRTNAKTKQPVSLLILEGYTEQVFYPIVRDCYLTGIRIQLVNIKGRGNVNKQVLAKIFQYYRDNPKDMVRAYCCVDAETQKSRATPLDVGLIRRHVNDRKMVRVLSIDGVVTDPDIESWFFYDIKGIYKFLRAKKSLRNVKRYSIPPNFGKRDLQDLFSRFRKEYIPGERAAYFIRNLDIEKIVNNCQQLRNGIELIKSQAHDLTNHLFPARR